MRRKRGLSWLLPLSIAILMFGVLSAIAWLASRLIDTEQAVEPESTTARPCYATVRAISDTKTKMGYDSVYQVELSVQPSDGSPPHTMTLRDGLTEDEAKRVRPGEKFPCFTDEHEPDDLEVFWTQ
jgi:hypothetical protein